MDLQLIMDSSIGPLNQKFIFQDTTILRELINLKVNNSHRTILKQQDAVTANTESGYKHDLLQIRRIPCECVPVCDSPSGMNVLIT